MTNNGPIAVLNGRSIPAEEAAVPVTDMGLVHGAAVTEMLRTFAGKPFRLADHLDRLFRSAERSFISVPFTAEELSEQIEQVVRHNFALLPPGHDLGVIVFVTAGPNPTYLGRSAVGGAGTTCVHTFPLPFELWAERFERGQDLIIPPTRAIPPACLDPTVKSRSRLHWFIADRQARQENPAASAILVDGEGCLTECSSGNLFLVDIDGVLRTPPDGVALGGISRRVVIELAAVLGLAVEKTPLWPDDAWAAAEAFTTSTPYGLMPVRSLDGRPIGDGQPGPVFRKLLSAWSNTVGVDIAEQMRRVAAERSTMNSAGERGA